MQQLSILVNGVGIVQGSVLVLTLLWRGPRNPTNYWLAAMISVLVLAMINTLNIISGARLPYVQNATNSTMLLIGPLLYIIAQPLRSRDTMKALWHFVPFALYLPLSLIFSLAENGAKHSFPVLQYIHYQWLPLFWNVQLGAYLLMTLRLLGWRGITYNLRKQWINQLVLSITCIWLLNIALKVFSAMIFTLSDLVLLNITAFFSILIVSIVFQHLSDPISRKSATQKHLMADPQKSQTSQKLTRLMSEEKMYRDPNVRLGQIAGKLFITDRSLSALIREEYGQNFNEFLNSYRIEEVILRLTSQDAEQYTIMALANEAGFRSNSVFYQAFKSKTGMTPRAYLRGLVC